MSHRCHGLSCSPRQSARRAWVVLRMASGLPRLLGAVGGLTKAIRESADACLAAIQPRRAVIRLQSAEVDVLRDGPEAKALLAVRAYEVAERHGSGLLRRVIKQGLAAVRPALARNAVPHQIAAHVLDAHAGVHFDEWARLLRDAHLVVIDGLLWLTEQARQLHQATGPFAGFVKCG